MTPVIDVFLDPVSVHCKDIYDALMGDRDELHKAFAAKHFLASYNYVNVQGCLSGIARRVRAEAQKLHEAGCTEESTDLLRRLALVTD
jgi:hypothetical protein